MMMAVTERSRQRRRHPRDLGKARRGSVVVLDGGLDTGITSSSSVMNKGTRYSGSIIRLKPLQATDTFQ